MAHTSYKIQLSKTYCCKAPFTQRTEFEAIRAPASGDLASSCGTALEDSSRRTTRTVMCGIRSSLHSESVSMPLAIDG